jgi:Uma2 family endonuclease
MTSLLADSGLTWADVLRIWKELDVPEGWRPEITPEGIIMTPPPSGAHNLTAEEVHHALGAAIDRNTFGIFQSLGVAVRSIGGIFIPDICVVARAGVSPGTDPVDSEHVALAVEITSKSNAEHDRKRKKWAYAHGGIAQYLLIDAFDEDGPSVWVFSQPEEGTYRTAVRTPFGKPVRLADPVATVIESTLFPAP